MSDGRLPAGLIIEAPWPEGEAAAWATAEERAAAAAFGSERRRREYLTWRALVRRELGRDVRIAYDAVGAPVLENRPEYLSVSHCNGRVAVCLSLRRCAVDIEPVTRNFGRVLSRYMTPEEQALADDPLLPAAVWCAKETLYKYVGRRELDLLRDLRITEADLAAGCLAGRIAGGAPVAMRLLCRDGYLATFIL
ncbi:MAG: 4'-phosphopantetheinyl transferase superfamily protein [Alistipes sp.]